MRPASRNRTAWSAALRSLLPETGLKAVRQRLEHEATAAIPGSQLLLGPVAEIPRKGYEWKGKTARAAELPDTGTLTVVPKASVRARVRILPGPSYELTGTPGFAVGLRAPLPAGRISVSAQRAIRNRLVVKFSHSGDTRVIEALSADFPVIVNLEDPESLLNAKNFKSARLTASGTIRFGAALKASRSWMQSFDAAAGAVAGRLKATAGYTMNWVRTGDFKFTVSRARGGRMRIWLTESRKKRTARSLSVGAEMTFGGLRQSVAPLLKEISELPDGLDGIVETYSRPGRLFRDRLRARLKASDPALRALLDIAAGGGEPAARRLVNSLIDAIVASAGARAERWTDLLAGRIGRVVEDAVHAAPVTPDHRDKLAAHVRSKLREALDDLNESLLADLQAALREDAKPVTEMLGRFADGPAALSERLDASAERCMAPLKRLLARYRMLEERVAEAVEMAEKQRLTLQYGRAVSESKVASTLLRLRFDPRTEQGRTLYRQMLNGDFADAMAAGLDDGNDTVTLENCVFKRAFQRTASSGLTFNLFGREIASRRALSARIRAEHGVGGQINLFEADADVSEEHVAFGEGQSIRIGSLIHFITSPDGADALTVQLNYTDRHMKRKELGEYLASLEDAGLIGQGATHRVMELESAPGTFGPLPRSIQIDTALELSRNELAEAGSLDEGEITFIAIEEQLYSHRRIGWAEDALEQLADTLGGDLANRIFGWRDYSRPKIKRALGIAGIRMSRTQRHVLYLVRGILDRADELASFVAHWRELDRIGRSVGNDAEKLDAATLEEIRRLHADMIADLSAWADARNWIVGLTREDLSPVGAAFLASLRRLSRRSDEPLIPIIAWTESGETRRNAIV